MISIINQIPDTAIQNGKLSKIPNIIQMSLYNMLVTYGKLDVKAATSMVKFFKDMFTDQGRPHNEPIIVGNLNYKDFKIIIDILSDTPVYSPKDRYYHVIDLFYYD